MDDIDQQEILIRAEPVLPCTHTQCIELDEDSVKSITDTIRIQHECEGGIENMS